MLPVFVFIYFKAKMEYQKYEVVELTAPRKINSPSFGSLPPVLVFFLAGLATLCISVIIEPLVSLIPMPDSIKELFEMLFYKSSPIDSFISVIILAPLCEEFLCRGMMLRGMLEHISPIKAILWSAFLFALLHLNPWQAIPAFALGAFFGWVYWKSGSIWLVIFLHFVNNFSAMILARFFPDLPIDVALSDMLSTGWYALTYAVAIIVFTCITLLFIKKLNSTDGKKTLSAEIPADSEN
jgi:membrane protease YdiL (CAAX protease family)